MRYFWIVLSAGVAACSPAKKKESMFNSAEAQVESGSVETGKLLYASTCKTCHGENAEGNRQFQAPALANGNTWYLSRQLVNYQKGIRGYSENDTLGYQMAAMAKTLRDSAAIRDVVTYLAAIPRQEGSAVVTGDAKKGESIYQTICGSCHGPNAVGNEKLNAPRLNGLNEWYLKQQIRKFRNSIRGAHPEDKFGAQMISMMALLPDNQSVNDVIAYIQTAATPRPR